MFMNFLLENAIHLRRADAEGERAAQQTVSRGRGAARSLGHVQVLQVVVVVVSGVRTICSAVRRMGWGCRLRRRLRWVGVRRPAPAAD